MNMPTIVKTEITQEIHNRVVTFTVQDSASPANNTATLNVRILFSDVGISTGVFPSEDKALVENALRAYEHKCHSAKCLSDVTEIYLSTTTALE